MFCVAKFKVLLTLSTELQNWHSFFQPYCGLVWLVNWTFKLANHFVLLIYIFKVVLDKPIIWFWDHWKLRMFSYRPLSVRLGLECNFQDLCLYVNHVYLPLTLVLCAYLMTSPNLHAKRGRKALWGDFEKRVLHLVHARELISIFYLILPYFTFIYRRLLYRDLSCAPTCEQ